MRRHKIVNALLWLEPGSRVQLVQFNGSARLFADLSDGFQRAYFLSGSYDPEFFAIAAPFLSGGGVFFDVGANVGFCSFGLMSALADPRVEYHLFEAQAGMCALLGRSAALYSGQRVLVNHACVADAPGESRLRIVPGHLGASHVAPDGSEAVPNLVLDEYVRERGIDRVAFLKLDVEGSEPLALRGARTALVSGLIEVVYFELSGVTLARAGFDLRDCSDPLRDAGFEIFYVRAADVTAQVAKGEPETWLDVHGHRLRVSPLRHVPTEVQTDLMAVHARALAAYREGGDAVPVAAGV